MAKKLFWKYNKYTQLISYWQYSQVRPNGRGHDKGLICSLVGLNLGPLWYKTSVIPLNYITCKVKNLKF